jgi:glutamyl-tRNA synthetase
MIDQITKRTRLAPSPTGALHLGNARTFLINALLARQRGWEIVLRIEDLDGPRIKKGADLQAIEDLRWLGLSWDSGPTYQSAKLGDYRKYIDRLVVSKAAYACICTRKEAESAASAPHAADGATVYPGVCRDRFSSIEEARNFCGRESAIRFDTRGAVVEFTDEFHGRRHFDVEKSLGDFVIAKADGTPAYQLAVVVDDVEAGITHVVRGDDLLDSTPRQILLYRALGCAEHVPHYVHLPLVIGPDGRRLAKRHGDTRVATYRAAGVTPERMLALLARWSGVDAGDSISFGELLAAFDLAKVPREAVVMQGEDDAWLRGG